MSLELKLHADKNKLKKRLESLHGLKGHAKRFKLFSVAWDFGHGDQPPAFVVQAEYKDPLPELLGVNLGVYHSEVTEIKQSHSMHCIEYYYAKLASTLNPKGHQYV